MLHRSLLAVNEPEMVRPSTLKFCKGTCPLFMLVTVMLTGQLGELIDAAFEIV